MSIKFNTKFVRSKAAPEKNDGKSIVEKAGYVPAKKRIEDMIAAGQRLVDHRKAMYDYPDGIIPDDVQPDPTRAKNYDLADATQDRLAADNRIRAVAASRKAQIASQSAQEASLEVKKGDQGVDVPPQKNPPE